MLWNFYPGYFLSFSTFPWLSLSLAHTLVHMHPHTHTSIHTRSLLPLHSSRSCATGFASTAIVLCHREQKAKGSRVKVLNEFFITRSSLKYKFSSAGVRKVGSVRERVLVCVRERERERGERGWEHGEWNSSKTVQFQRISFGFAAKKKIFKLFSAVLFLYFHFSALHALMHMHTHMHTNTHYHKHALLWKRTHTLTHTLENKKCGTLGAKDLGSYLSVSWIFLYFFPI